MKQANPPLLPGMAYHIVNHAIGRENLFVNKGNYQFFLKRYSKYIAPIADTYAYCLMPNHFHFLIWIKEKEALQEAYRLVKTERGTPEEKIVPLQDGEYAAFLSKEFANMFSSYTQAFNKQQERRGSLFIKNFRRYPVETDAYFRNVIHYIHNNPVHHGFVDEMDQWGFSSWDAYCSERITNIRRSEGLALFDSREGFIRFHKKPCELHDEE